MIPQQGVCGCGKLCLPYLTLPHLEETLVQPRVFTILLPLSHIENHCCRPTASVGRQTFCRSACLTRLWVPHHTVNKLVFSQVSQQMSSHCRLRLAQKLSCESLDPKEPPHSATEKDSLFKHIWDHCILLSASHRPPSQSATASRLRNLPPRNLFGSLSERMNLTTCFLI